jgi:hypothetical protein
MLHFFRSKLLKHFFTQLIMSHLGGMIEKVSPVNLQPDRFLDGILNLFANFFQNSSPFIEFKSIAFENTFSGIIRNTNV